MTWIIGIIAAVVAVAGLLVSAGYLGYLAMLNNAAKKRGLSGGAAAELVKSRWAVAGGATAAAVIGLMITSSSSIGADVLGLVLAGGAGVVAKKGLDSTRKQLGSGS
ncbi:hypothetical protein SAMN05443637_12712 [Pseudonocardia thermophila]|uniref:Uncharacterized protein n=1 Tax=Pseudonocardia thermophila TaxID=1848 RepID=A0A1M7ABJ1_PSETH|nr:hypothetical protein [Pseudonocardia thermophila]SHL40042.1 hypothetical protein SAMN05443637_12712 [Pseudonocardia thermophila]